VIVTGRVAANTDAGVANLHTLPFEIHRVVRAVLIVGVEVLPVSPVDVKPDLVQCAVVEQRVHARRRSHRLRRQTQHRSAQRDGEHEHERSNPRPTHHLSYNPNSMRNVRLHTGPGDSVAVRGSVRSSRITFSDSSKNLFTYQFTPVVHTRSAVEKT